MPRARPTSLLLALLVVIGLWVIPGPARADDSTYRIELITMSPGDAFYTRAGHAALVVVEQWPDGRELTVAYNYGDANFSDPMLPLSIVFGDAKFFVSTSGDLFDTVEYYGPLQNRDVYRQRLALTPAQAKAVAEHLAAEIEPDNREYPFHYLRRTCTTELRTVLDEVLGGTIAQQLADPDPWTSRQYQQLSLDNYVVIALVGDLVFGRLHDAPIDRYFAMLWPERMRDYLQQVKVPDPAGGDGKVPLASAPELLAERGGPPSIEQPNRVSWFFWPVASVLVLVGGLWLGGRGPSKAAGLWLAAWALPMGLMGLCIALLSVASTIPELGQNELVLSVLATDLALLGPAVAWLRGRTTLPRWLPRYATIRLAVVAIAVALRAVGVFVQEPWIIPVGSLVCSAGLWLFVRRARGKA